MPYRGHRLRGPESPQCFSTWSSPRDASLPSLGSQPAWFPALTGTMKALRLPTCASASTYLFRCRRPRDPPVFVFAVALLKGGGPFRPGQLGAQGNRISLGQHGGQESFAQGGAPEL